MSVLDRLKTSLGLRPPILIAEIGNNHFGSFQLAKMLIRMAKESGADLVKFQAGVKKGSMQPEFYKHVGFSLSEYLDLIAFGDMIGTTVFFSIFDKEFSEIDNTQKYLKIASSQSNHVKDYDNSRTFISFGNFFDAPKNLISCAPMMASQYMVDKDIALPKNYGYSCNQMGIRHAVRSGELGALYIEKHFTLEHGMTFRGQVFRDTVHGATPEEFLKMSRIVKGRF